MCHFQRYFSQMPLVCFDVAKEIPVYRVSNINPNTIIIPGSFRVIFFFFAKLNEIVRDNHIIYSFLRTSFGGDGGICLLETPNKHSSTLRVFVLYTKLRIKKP